ncbi:MAG: CPBP family intramembrane metalloprotease [Oscillospiraceae bacterium]|nr:CPBP family intramembrane metalloprotease [Oscillospiraceae bacterium]
MTDIKERKLNPYDPFDNPTESCAYRTDYRRVDSRIEEAGYEIPILPDKTERKGIRRLFNITGLSLFLSAVGVNVIFMAVLVVLEVILAGSFDPNAMADAETYINYDSSILMAMNGMLFLAANTLAAVVGGRLCGIRARSYYRPFEAKKSRLVGYIFIGIFVQALTGILYTFISGFLENAGIQDYVNDIDTYINAKTIIVTGLYTCIIAPVTEELLYRGFVLKNLSCVSQKFGIIVSAMLFGFAHENIAQFLLAMPIGIFMARITIKHNSIIPSTLVHIGVNTIAFMLNWVYTVVPTDANGVPLMEGLGGLAVMGVDILYYLIAGVGMILWILEVRRSRLPANTIRQSYRGVRVALASPWLVAVCLFHTAMAVMGIVMQNMM